MNTLRLYQEKGVDHLLSMPFGLPHALLADAPGTGKTIMAIEAFKRANCQNAIILCPAIVKEQWARQMVAWDLCGPDDIQILYGLDSEMDNRPWVIVNYDIIRDRKVNSPDGTEKKVSSRNKKRLTERNWHALVMDEAHKLKEHTSAQTKAVLGHKHGIAGKAYWKWPMSGTITPNHAYELYPLLKSQAEDCIKPYNVWDAYIERFCGGAYLNGRGSSNIPELTQRIQPYMLRRELKDVWKECPPIIDNLLWLDVPFTEHPEWIGSDFMYEATERRIVAESKIPQIVAYLAHRLEGGIGKLVCFTYHRQVIERVAHALQKYNPLKIYGGITPKQREAYLAKFKTDADSRLFLLQIASGGEGVDGLQHVASELVLAEPEWSPGREDQAIDRLRRIGQEHPVILTKLYAKTSYEETIYHSNQRKRAVIDVLLKPNGGTFTMSIDSTLESINKTQKEILDVLKTIAGNGQTNFAPGANQPVAPSVPPPAAPPFVAAPAPPVPVAASAPPASIPGTVAPLPPGVVSAPVSAPPPSVPTAVAPPSEGLDEFTKKVIATLEPFGPAEGVKKCGELAQLFGKQKASEVDPQHWPLFLQHCEHAASQFTKPAA